MIDNRKNGSLVDEFLIATTSITQGFIIEVNNGSEPVYFNGEVLTAERNNIKMYENDGDSGLLDIVKKLRSEGLDARILDVFKDGEEITIQADLTAEYQRLKLL